MRWMLSIHWVLVAALWYFVNGILHSVAVLRKHKGTYDRELLRLLMDGYVLILSGVLLFVCWLMLRHQIPYGAVISIIVACFMLVYCALIFPFLKSFATIAISIMLLVVSVKTLLSFPHS